MSATRQTSFPLVIAAFLLFLTCPCPEALSDSVACAGCSEVAQDEEDDLEMMITGVQAIAGGGIDPLCMIEVRLVGGGYSQTCTSTESQCSRSRCTKTWAMQARAKDLATDGCSQVYFDIESQQVVGQSGSTTGIATSWENNQPGEHSAGALEGGTYQGIEDPIVVEAGCGTGTTSVNLRFATTQYPVPLDGTTYWVGPNATLTSGTTLSDDRDMTVRVGCTQCTATWSAQCCAANPECCTGGVPDPGSCCENPPGGDN